MLINIKKHLAESIKALNINTLGLSLAFAVFLIIFIQVRHEMKFDSFHKNANSIYRVELGFQGQKMALMSIPIGEYLSQYPIIEMVAFSDISSNNIMLMIENDNIKKQFEEKIIRVTSTFTDIFSFYITDGSIDALKQPANVIIPESLAIKFFNKKTATGLQIETPSSILTIGGVYKDFPKNSSLQNVIYSSIPYQEKGRWSQLNYYAYVKIAPKTNLNVELKSIEYELQKASLEIEPNMPEPSLYFTSLKDLHFTTDVMYDFTPKSNKQISYILICIALSILIMAAINYMNYSMALIPKRMKNVNIRKILGAKSYSIRLENIFKSVLISSFSFMISVIIVFIISKTPITSLLMAEINLLHNIDLIVVTCAISIIVGIISEIYPSFYMTSFAPAIVLKGKSGISFHLMILRKIMISIQFIATFTLIISTWFMYLQNKFMQNADLGYDKDLIVLVDTNEHIQNQKNVFTNLLKSDNRIEDVTYASIIMSVEKSYNAWNTQYKGKNIMFQWIPVNTSFIKTMNIQIHEGRDFNEYDNNTKWGKYIFNEKAKKEFDLDLNTIIDSVEIIGFIPNIQHTTFHAVPEPMAFYVPGKTQHNAEKFAYIKIRKGSDVKTVLEHIKSVMSNFETEQPLNVRFYDDIINQTYVKEKHLNSLVSIFSLIAIIISVIGVLGLVFLEIEYRKKEISIRKTLGANTTDILYLINKSFIEILCISFIISCPVSYYLVNSWISNFSNHTFLHWWVFLISGLAMLTIILSLISWQVWKATVRNPVETLKID
ncbi:MAG: ABC transporter permease [Bacteroidales bacterium]|jgi:putative ABC transport system permease protein|nr:ABC transporter permease [Bacteroidales bacterium]